MSSIFDRAAAKHNNNPVQEVETMMKATENETPMHTTETFYDLDPLAGELWVITGPPGWQITDGHGRKPVPFQGRRVLLPAGRVGFLG